MTAEQSFTDQLLKTMQKRGVQQKDLAKSLSVSGGRVSQILSGGSGLTMKTMSRLAKALNCELSIQLKEK